MNEMYQMTNIQICTLILRTLNSLGLRTLYLKWTENLNRRLYFIGKFSTIQIHISRSPKNRQMSVMLLCKREKTSFSSVKLSCYFQGTKCKIKIIWIIYIINSFKNKIKNVKFKIFLWKLSSFTWILIWKFKVRRINL